MVRTSAQASSRQHDSTAFDANALTLLLQEEIASRIGCPPADVGVSVPISRFALESVDVVGLAASLEAATGIAVDEALFVDSPSISTLVARVLGAAEREPLQTDVRQLRAAPPSREPERDAAEQHVAEPTGESYASRFARLNSEHEALRAQGLYFYQSVIEDAEGAWVTVEGRRLLMASSYAYLALGSEARVHESSHAALRRFGSGSHGSPLLAGTTTLHRQLEKELADFKQTEGTLLFSSGFVANVSTIATLAGPGDVIITDRTNHASIAAGCRHSRASVLAYRNHDLADLESCLKQAGTATKLVVADAIFSMSGTLLDLPRVSALCRKYDALLMVDEAHSVGVLGATGSGIEEHFGLPPDTIDVKMGTLSKAIPSVGGYVAASRQIVDALKHNAHGFIFSGSLPPSQVAAALEALRILRAEPQRVAELRALSDHYRSRLRAMGLEVMGEGTPIAPILCPSVETCLSLAQRCQRAGVFVLPVVYPAVPINAPRLRTTVTLSHSRADVEYLADVIGEAAAALGLVSARSGLVP